MNVAMFHRAAVCRALLAQAGMADLWTLDGPTNKAVALRAEARKLPDRDRLYLSIAFAIWHLDGGPCLGDVLHHLPDHDVGNLVGALISLRGDTKELRDALAKARGR